MDLGSIGEIGDWAVVRRTGTGILVIAGLFGLAVVAGLVVARWFGPDQLVVEVEERLSSSLGTPVSVRRLRVSPGTFVRVESDGVTAWTTSAGHGLEIERISGSVDVLSLFKGEIELARLRLDGAHLRLSTSDSRDGFHPVGSMLAGPSEPPRLQHIPNPDELLAPLISLETLVRRVLLAPPAASVLELRNARISLDDTQAPSRGVLELEDVTGRLVHHRFSNRSDFWVEARLSQGGESQGSIKLDGHRAGDGSIRIALSLDAAELESTIPYVRKLRPRTEISGQLTGEWIYETPEPGTGRLQATLTCVNLISSIPGTKRSTEVIRSPRIDFVGTLEINPQSAILNDLQITNRDTSLRISGEVSRPLNAGSVAQLDLGLENLDLAQARHLIGWLPEIEREEAAAIVAPLSGGRLDMLRARGRASLSGWQDLLAGRSRRLPKAFAMEVKLVEMIAHFGDANHLEDLEAELSWVGDHVEIRGATAVLNGDPLPILDVTIEGFPNFLAGDPQLRVMNSEALPLSGLDTLWNSLRPRRDRQSPDAPRETEYQIGLEFEYLEHPLLLWPLSNGSATIVAKSGGVHIEAKDAIWAGVPIEVDADWSFRPTKRVSVRLEATAPPIAAEVPPHRDDWARGRFTVGEIPRGRWRQHEARGHFVAKAGRVRIRELDIDLAPTGRVQADGLLDLSMRNAVPFRVNFGLVDGDGPALAKLFGLPDRQIEGRMKLDGSFEGVLEPGTPFFSQLDGLLDLTAVDGVIRKVTPPVVAIAEGAAEIESFDPSDFVPYERVETVLEFSGGEMYSASFSLDGPRVGIVASGKVELAAPIKTIDAEVYVFLFQKLDRVLGKIPILNRMLLGADDNLVATAFQVSGQWADPTTKSILLPRRFGSMSQLVQGVPMFVMRGIRALGSLVSVGRSEREAAPETPPDPEIAPEPAPDTLPPRPSQSES